jgi:hypothetical protein
MAGAGAEREFFGDCAAVATTRINIRSPHVGTNFKAWITTILRNSYFNVYRHIAKVAEDAMAPGAP